MTSFSDNLASIAAISDTEFSVVIGEDWLQGRTAFGGLSSAVIIEAMNRVVPQDRPLRTMAVSFIGPAPAGEHRIRLRPLREGGSVTHMQGELVCNGEVATAINAAFGKPVNNPALLVADSRPEHLKAPDDCQVFPFIEGLTPAFTQHFDARFEYGQPPMSGGDQADFGMWLRFKEPTEMKIPALIALADMPPMPGLNMVKPPCLGSSLSWYLEFPALTTDIAPDGWWYYDYRSQAGSGGYFNNYGTIWAPNGQAAMFTRQVAMVFQK